MKNKIMVLAAALLLLSLASCRDKSDVLDNYGYKDNLVYKPAETSFAAKFDILWSALDQNYSLWDYEASQGVDWDQVYATYYPRFKALDAREEVTDKEVEELMNGAFGVLHDGHLALQMYNHRSGQFVNCSPQDLRIVSRPDYKLAEAFMPDLTYYKSASAGENQITESDEANTTFGNHLSDVNIGITEKILEYAEKELGGKLTPVEQDRLDSLRMMKKTLDNLRKNAVNMGATAMLQAFNDLMLHFGYLNVKAAEVYTAEMLDFAIVIKYALLGGNVPYIYIDGFSLAPYMGTEDRQKLLDAVESSPELSKKCDKVKTVWQKWFNKIQELSTAGTLKGVILDVRSNGGGYASDYRYMLGALLPSGGHEVMAVRQKNGPGRYDYMPNTYQRMKTYEGSHAVVTQPIAVLANCKSISMAEVTSLGCQLLDNGKLIGTQTWGGLCGLVGGEEEYSQVYASSIGEKDKSSVWAYIPVLCSFPHGKVIESVGLTPDIEVALDEEKWLEGLGPDSQLDRALQYIRSGN